MESQDILEKIKRKIQSMKQKETQLCFSGLAAGQADSDLAIYLAESTGLRATPPSLKKANSYTVRQTQLVQEVIS